MIRLRNISAEEVSEIFRHNLSLVPIVKEIDHFSICLRKDYLVFFAQGMGKREYVVRLSVNNCFEKPSAYLDFISRGKKLAGRGYGRQIYLALENSVIDLGCDRIALDSKPERKDFWESLGFRYICESEFGNKLMEKTLR